MLWRASLFQLAARSAQDEKPVLFRVPHQGIVERFVGAGDEEYLGRVAVGVQAFELLGEVRPSWSIVE